MKHERVDYGENDKKYIDKYEIEGTGHGKKEIKTEKR